MKKLILMVLVIAAITNAKAQKNWSVGVFTSGSGNHAQFSAGSSEANGRFSSNPYGTGTFGLMGRYFLNNHWSLQSGMNLSQVGFEYAVSNDYSLLKKHNEHATKNNVGIGVLQVPLTAIFVTKTNCSNFRFFVGSGVTLTTSLNNVNETKNIVAKGDEGAINNVYVNQTVSSSQFVIPTVQFMWGIEKLMKKGGIIQGGFVANMGFTNIATSDVTYSIENKVYNHTFTNKGDYMGMMLNYYFKPFKKR